MIAATERRNEQLKEEVGHYWLKPSIIYPISGYAFSMKTGIWTPDIISFYAILNSWKNY